MILLLVVLLCLIVWRLEHQTDDNIEYRAGQGDVTEDEKMSSISVYAEEQYVKNHPESEIAKKYWAIRSPAHSAIKKN